MSVLAADLRRAFRSRGFFIAAVFVCLCLVLSQFVALRAVLSGETDISGQPAYGAALCLQASQEEAFLAALPLAAALPFTSAFAEDVRSGFGRFWLPRSGRRADLASRILVAALAGGSVICLGELMAMVVMTIVTLPGASGAEPAGDAFAGQLLAVEWLGKLMLTFLSGALFALIGLLSSIVTESRYMAWTVPFVSYYLLVILTERYFPALYALDPNEWLSPGPAWQVGTPGPALIMGEFICILALISGAVMQRRLEDV